MKIKGSDEYKEFMRETMVWLLSWRSVALDNSDVITCAIKYGAHAMLREILKTKDVFRFDISENKTRFDVSNFTIATMVDVQESDSKPASDSTRDYKKQNQPKTPYLRKLLSCYDEWRDKSILAEQPMRQLTKPYFSVVQRCYFILGLLQLIYMILFTRNYMPNTCSLVELFNISASGSNCSIAPDPAGNSSEWSPDQQASRDSPSSFWQAWPGILFAGYVCSFFVDIYSASHASFSKFWRNLDSRVGQRVSVRWPTKVLLMLAQMFPALSFCVAVFVWFDRYSNGISFLSYLEATSMVFLFGWTTNLVFFSGITKQFCVFALVLKDIILKDIILSFILVFLFTLLAFSYALHVLSLYNLPLDNEVYLSATVYDVFMASLGSGEYVQTSREERSRVGIYFGLFEIVVIGYVCLSAIILLNVLIAMLNHRYDKVRQRAENFWRFQMLQIALDLERVPVVGRLFAWLLTDDCCSLCCGLCCCYCNCVQLHEATHDQNRKLISVKLHIG